MSRRAIFFAQSTASSTCPTCDVNWRGFTVRRVVPRSTRIVGYCFGIRSERRIRDEVHLNLVYRWFRRLGLDGDVPDHSTISKNRHGRFRGSDLLRRLFETVLAHCLEEGLVGGEGFAMDGFDTLLPAGIGLDQAALPSARRRRWSQSSSRLSIRRPAEPAPMVGSPTSPTRRTI